MQLLSSTLGTTISFQGSDPFNGDAPILERIHDRSNISRCLSCNLVRPPMRTDDDMYGFLLERAFSGSVGFLIGGACGLIVELIRLAAGWIESINQSVILVVAIVGAVVGILIGAVILNAVLGIISLLAGFFMGLGGWVVGPIADGEDDWPRWITVLFILGLLIAALLYVF